MSENRCFSMRSIALSLNNITFTGKCPKPEQFLKAEHLLKHAFSLPRSIFLWSLRLKTLNLSITTKKDCSAIDISQNIHVCLHLCLKVIM